jgi:hypothetical protein
MKKIYLGASTIFANYMSIFLTNTRDTVMHFFILE